LILALFFWVFIYSFFGYIIIVSQKKPAINCIGGKVRLFVGALNKLCKNCWPKTILLSQTSKVVFDFSSSNFNLLGQEKLSMFCLFFIQF